MQQVTPYRVADKPWSPNLGSHRAIVRVERAAAPRRLLRHLAGLYGFVAVRR